jgi:hypothetical protein
LLVVHAEVEVEADVTGHQLLLLLLGEHGVADDVGAAGGGHGGGRGRHLARHHQPDVLVVHLEVALVVDGRRPLRPAALGAARPVLARDLGRPVLGGLDARRRTDQVAVRRHRRLVVGVARAQLARVQRRLLASAVRRQRRRLRSETRDRICKFLEWAYIKTCSSVFLGNWLHEFAKKEYAII